MVAPVVGKDFEGDELEEVASLVDFADVLVAQPRAMMVDGRLVLAAGSVAGRRVRRDDGVENSRREVGDVAYLPRRRLREPVDDVEVLLAKQEQAVHRQLRILVDIGHRRFLFIGSQHLKHVQLSYRRI